MRIRKNSKKLPLAMLTIAFLLTYCTLAPEKAETDSIEIKFKQGKNLNSENWKCQVIETNTVCIPTNWNFIDQDKVFFFAALDNDKNTFFTIIKSDINSSKLNADRYLKEGYSQMLGDSTEALRGYTVKKMTFSDKQSYYAEYFTTINTKEYFAYSMVFEKEGYLYDIALKLPEEDSPKYKDTFKDAVFNFRINGKPVFGELDEIENIEIIDLSK